VHTQWLHAVLVLLGVFVILPVGLFLLLRLVARRWLMKRPAHPYAAGITPTGFVFYGYQALVLLIFAAANKLEPDGALGGFLHTPGGLVVTLLIWVILTGIVEALLRTWGCPTTRPR
jgi:hypothetical protein